MALTNTDVFIVSDTGGTNYKLTYNALLTKLQTDIGVGLTSTAYGLLSMGNFTTQTFSHPGTAGSSYITLGVSTGNGGGAVTAYATGTATVNAPQNSLVGYFVVYS